MNQVKKTLNTETWQSKPRHHVNVWQKLGVSRHNYLQWRLFLRRLERNYVLMKEPSSKSGLFNRRKKNSRLKTEYRRHFGAIIHPGTACTVTLTILQN